ncbi:MAG: hypothetical protein ACREOZ_02490, partial [Gloeomargaritales cyanobacterium]
CHTENMFDCIFECHVKATGHATSRHTHDKTMQRYGQSIPRTIVDMFLTNCQTCLATQKNPKPKAGATLIVTTMFGQRTQMDCIDMQRFVKGLRKAYQALPRHDREKVNFNEIAEQRNRLLGTKTKKPDPNWPRFLINIADHASKYGQTYTATSKRAVTMAWLLAQYYSCVGASKILHTDNGREFISLAYDKKYKGAKYVKWTAKEKRQIIEKVEQLIPGTKQVHGRARHSQSQGFIENRNKACINFLTKWCLQNKTAYYWLGLPTLNYHLNCRTNRGIGMTPFEYMFGCKPQQGISELPMSKPLREEIFREEELNRSLNLSEDQMLEYVNQPMEAIARLPQYSEPSDYTGGEWRLQFSPDELGQVATGREEKGSNSEEESDEGLPEQVGNRGKGSQLEIESEADDDIEAVARRRSGRAQQGQNREVGSGGEESELESESDDDIETVRRSQLYRNRKVDSESESDSETDEDMKAVAHDQNHEVEIGRDECESGDDDCARLHEIGHDSDDDVVFFDDAEHNNLNNVERNDVNDVNDAEHNDSDANVRSICLTLNCSSKSCRPLTIFAEEVIYYQRLVANGEYFDFHFCHSFSVLAYHAFHPESIELFIYPVNPKRDPSTKILLDPAKKKRIVGVVIMDSHFFLIDFTLGERKITIVDGLGLVKLEGIRPILEYLLLEYNLAESRRSVDFELVDKSNGTIHCDTRLTRNQVRKNRWQVVVDATRIRQQDQLRSNCSSTPLGNHAQQWTLRFAAVPSNLYG